MSVVFQSRFQDATGQIFDFDANGESNRGYQIYSVVSPGGYYQNVGSYNTTHLLRLDSGFRLDWESSCDPVGACDECPALGRQSNRYMQVQVRFCIPTTMAQPVMGNIYL